MCRKQSVRGFAALPALALFCVLTLWLSVSCTNYFHNFMEWPNQGGGSNAGGAQQPEPLIRDMVTVPAGTGFQYHADSSNPATASVSSAFKMGKYEVTQEQYEAVMGYNPSYFPNNPAPGEAQGKRPVEKVSWYEAIAFCNKLSVREGKTPAYEVLVNNSSVDWAALDCGASKWTTTDYGDVAEIIGVPTGTLAEWDATTIVTGANGYRLPTEIEWEWAAMGADINGRLKGYAGSGESGSATNNITYYAWYMNNSGDNYTATNTKTHEVGRRLPNELGLYDMSGNVVEWVWDWESSGGDWDSNANLSAGFTGAISGTYRMCRGGDWGNVALRCAVAYRGYDSPYYRSYNVGFRVLCP